MRIFNFFILVALVSFSFSCNPILDNSAEESEKNIFPRLNSLEEIKLTSSTFLTEKVNQKAFQNYLDHHKFQIKTFHRLETDDNNIFYGIEMEKAGSKKVYYQAIYPDADGEGKQLLIVQE